MPTLTVRVTVGAPSADDVKKYFAEHPALFSNRRIYMLQDFTIQGDKAQIDALMPKLQATKTPAASLKCLAPAARSSTSTNGTPAS